MVIIDHMLDKRADKPSHFRRGLRCEGSDGHSSYPSISSTIGRPIVLGYQPPNLEAEFGRLSRVAYHRTLGQNSPPLSCFMGLIKIAERHVFQTLGHLAAAEPDRAWLGAQRQ